MTQDRLPQIPPETWTEAQREAAREIIDGPRGGLIAPFIPMLRSPELTTHSQRLGEYLRYRSVLGLRLSELAILVVARHWSQQVEWAIHAPIALRAGIAVDTVAAIACGARPVALPPDETVVYEFSIELLERREVGDALWARAVASFGEQGVVDLVGLNGYYSYLAMLMNAARTPAQHAGIDPLPPLATS